VQETNRQKQYLETRLKEQLSQACCRAGRALQVEPCRGQVLFSVFINGVDDELETCLKICGGTLAGRSKHLRERVWNSKLTSINKKNVAK